MIKYKRVLLKISGEALAGENRFGIDYDVVQKVCEQIKVCVEMGAEIGIVVGGGNFWRGRSGAGMDRTRADHMGMLATVMNSLALCDALLNAGVEARVQTAIEMRQIAEPYIRRRAMRHLERRSATSRRGGWSSSAAVPETPSSRPIRRPLSARRR